MFQIPGACKTKPIQNPKEKKKLNPPQSQIPLEIRLERRNNSESADEMEAPRSAPHRQKKKGKRERGNPERKWEEENPEV